MPAKEFEEMSPLEEQQWLEQRYLRTHEAGLKFLESHPRDPRRWRVVSTFCYDQLRGHPRFVTDWGPLDAGGALPNVQTNYATYHDRGFEVVGIALEDAELKPTDAPDEKAAKLKKSKDQLQSFIRKKGLAWPHYFDGKGWDCELVPKFAVSGIPAMFLLDQEGRVVTTDTRGDRLGEQLRRLLKL